MAYPFPLYRRLSFLWTGLHSRAVFLLPFCIACRSVRDRKQTADADLYSRTPFYIDYIGPHMPAVFPSSLAFLLLFRMIFQRNKFAGNDPCRHWIYHHNTSSRADQGASSTEAKSRSYAICESQYELDFRDEPVYGLKLIDRTHVQANTPATLGKISQRIFHAMLP